MALLTAGFIDGSRVKGEMLRRALWASTQGATGVVLPSDLKVLQTGTASTSVVISAGSAVIESAFANASGNSYIVTNDQAVTVAVPSSAGTYRVLLAVRDPQYAGQSTPSDPLTNAYTDVLIQSSFPSNQPYVHLANVVVGSTGATVTQANITDTREMASPRSQRDQAMLFPSANTNMSKSSYASWPLAPNSVLVPKWATELMVKITINGVEYTGTDTGVGGVRVIYQNSQGTQVAQNGIVTSKGAGRQTVAVLGRFSVLAAERGTVRYIGLQGYQSSGAGNFQQDYQSQLCYEWEFTERLA